jgi:ABC-type transport system involved in Fe-S cluster assembly fused permease/ATPase subunit
VDYGKHRIFKRDGNFFKGSYYWFCRSNRSGASMVSAGHLRNLELLLKTIIIGFGAAILWVLNTSPVNTINQKLGCDIILVTLICLLYMACNGIGAVQKESRKTKYEVPIIYPTKPVETKTDPCDAGIMYDPHGWQRE